MFLHLWPWHRKADKHDERMREFEICLYLITLEWSCDSENYYVHWLYKKDTERYSTDYVNCPPLKEKKTLGEKKTQERRTSRKNRKENSIQKSKTKLQDEIFLLVILAFPSCNSSSLLLQLFSFSLAFSLLNSVLQFRLVISSCNFGYGYGSASFWS